MLSVMHRIKWTQEEVCYLFFTDLYKQFLQLLLVIIVGIPFFIAYNYTRRFIIIRKSI